MFVIAIACVLLAAVVVAVAIVLVVLRLEEARLRRGTFLPELAPRESSRVVTLPQAAVASGMADDRSLTGNDIAGRTAAIRSAQLDRLLAPAEAAWMSHAAASIRTAADPVARRSLVAHVVRRGGAEAAWVVLDAVRCGTLEPWVACEELAAGSFDIGVVAGAASGDHDPRVRAVAHQLLEGILATAPLPRSHPGSHFPPLAAPDPSPIESVAPAMPRDAKPVTPAPTAPAYDLPTVSEDTPPLPRFVDADSLAHARAAHGLGPRGDADAARVRDGSITGDDSAARDGSIVRPAPFTRFPQGPT